MSSWIKFQVLRFQALYLQLLLLMAASVARFLSRQIERTAYRQWLLVTNALFEDYKDDSSY